jgi:hypothetical protein
MENQILPKWLVGGLGGLLIALVALLVVQKAHDLETTFANAKPANTIAVSGEGKVEATPDLATVDVGVLSQGTTAAEVTTQNNTKVDQLIAFLKQQGVAAADISTSNFSLSPQQDYSKGTPVITGYQGQQSLTVKVHGVDKSQSVLNSILGGAANNGANEIDNVSLSVENPDALQQQAQTIAIANAKTKAQALAQAAGLSLGKVVNVSEQNTEVPGPVPFALNSLAMSAGSAPVAPSIQTGSQEIDETMTVTFEVK